MITNEHLQGLPSQAQKVFQHLNMRSHERLFIKSGGLSRYIYVVKKAPWSSTRGPLLGARRNQAAGCLGQPSLQRDTGRIMKCAVHIGM